MLADYTGRATGLRFSTNTHGFAALSVPLVPMTISEAFEVYEWPGLPHVVVSDSAAGVVWEGRLEDIAIIAGGVALTALGYQRSLRDVPYTALWSASGSGGWRAVTAEENPNSGPSLFEMDNNNRLYIAPRKGESFATTGAVRGSVTWAAPHRGDRLITHFDASYDFLLLAGWIIRMVGCDFDFTNAVELASVTATGVTQSGSWSFTGINKERIYFEIRNATGAVSTITADTGGNYARLTGLRIKTDSGSVLASDIAAALATYVNGANSGQLSGSATLITATTTDLQNELYEDEYPADILDRLASLHVYEWGVYENRYLHFRPRGADQRQWYVDVTQILELQRSLENLKNSAYAVYKAADGGGALRTAIATSTSVDRYGVVRRGLVGVQTTSATEAGVHRDAYLNDRSTLALRARISFSRIYDAAGAAYPLYMLRAGDMVTMRNLPPTLSTEIDRIRSFVVGETDYDAVAGSIDIAPRNPVPTLVTIVGGSNSSAGGG